MSNIKKNELVISTNSPDETILLGSALGKGALGGGGLFVALTGEMGAGKTKLTQGIAQGLGIDEEYVVASPSFTLINEYPGETALNHMDLYRLGGVDEILELGYEEYFYGDGVTVVEWAERAGELLPVNRIDISISILSENIREFKILFLGKTNEKLSIANVGSIKKHLMTFIESKKGE